MRGWTLWCGPRLLIGILGLVMRFRNGVSVRGGVCFRVVREGGVIRCEV